MDCSHSFGENIHSLNVNAPLPRTTSEVHKLSEIEFRRRFANQFNDPDFEKLNAEITKLSDTAWKNYNEGKKAPHTQKAGSEFKDPEYKLNVEWLKARSAIEQAQSLYENPALPSTVLLINGSDRNETTCPGEISKSSRLINWARETLEDSGIEVKVLNLSEMTAEFGKMIYPCKGCVSTAMPLCHWPCSCYPHQSLGQVNDWMNDIYPLWVRAHGIMVVTPVYWHQAPSTLKLMMDRLVCADGGNEDPTSTQGKSAKLAKEIEMTGWDYPRHLSGRVFSVIVHGDVTGIDSLKENLTAWLNEMELIPAGHKADLGRMIGYLEPYALNHEALDQDKDLLLEVKNAAMNLGLAVMAKRSCKLESFTPQLLDPRPK